MPRPVSHTARAEARADRPRPILKAFAISEAPLPCAFNSRSWAASIEAGGPCRRRSVAITLPPSSPAAYVPMASSIPAFPSLPPSRQPDTAGFTRYSQPAGHCTTRRRRVAGRQRHSTTGAPDAKALAPNPHHHMLPSGSNKFLEVGMSTKSEPSPQKRSNWYDDPRMTAEQKREAVKQFHDWCERKGLLPPQGS